MVQILLDAGKQYKHCDTTHPAFTDKNWITTVSFLRKLKIETFTESFCSFFVLFPDMSFNPRDGITYQWRERRWVKTFRLCTAVEQKRCLLFKQYASSSVYVLTFFIWLLARHCSFAPSTQCFIFSRRLTTLELLPTFLYSCLVGIYSHVMFVMMGMDNAAAVQVVPVVPVGQVPVQSKVPVLAVPVPVALHTTKVRT